LLRAGREGRERHPSGRPSPNDSPDQGRPGQAIRHLRRLRRRVLAGSRTPPWRGRLRRRNDPRSGRERRREDTEVARAVGPRRRHDRDQTVQQFVRRVHERGGAVPPWAPKPQLKASIVQPPEAVGGDRAAGEIARHSLQPLAITGMDARRGLDIEPLDLRAQAPHHEGIKVRGYAAHAHAAPAAPRTGRDHSPDGGFGQATRTISRAPALSATV
jgi:hypothetical protein